MYGDFYRARKKLRKKHCYTRSRKEYLKKQKYWYFEKISLRNHLENHGKVTATFQGSIVVNKQSRSDHAPACPSWVEDTVDALMKANSLIEMIRCACQRKKKQLKLEEDCVARENDNATKCDKIHENRYPAIPNYFLGIQPNNTICEKLPDTRRQPAIKSTFGTLIPEHEIENSERELVYQTSVTASSGFAGNGRVLIDNEFDHDDKRLQNQEFVSCGSDDRNVIKSALHKAASDGVKQCSGMCFVKGDWKSSFKSQTFPEWDELYTRHPSSFPGNHDVILNGDVDFPTSDGYSSRIIYKTAPTSNTSSTSPVFVCSKAPCKTDSLVFGNEMNVPDTDFNVNAVYNKHGPDWDTLIRSGTLELEDGQPMGMDRPSPTSLELDTNNRQVPAEGFDSLCPNRSPGYQKSWILSLQRLWSKHKSLASAGLGLMVIGIFALFATGNVLSFLGLVVDMIVHTALLSVVVLVALVVSEANDTTGSLLQDCQSFMQLVVRLVSDFNINSMDDQTQPAVISPHGCSDSNDSQKYISDSSTPVPDANDSDLETDQTGADSGLPNESQVSTNCCSSEICEVSTMTESAMSSKSIQNTTQQSFAETMTDPVTLECIATQTDTICDEEGAVVNYLPSDEDGNPKSRLPIRSVGSQANIDAKKITEQAQRVQQKHQRNLRRLQRKFLAIRRSVQKDASELRRCDQSKGDFLAQLQLTIPVLHREKTRLTAEKFMVERQYTDQKKKSQDLIGRLAKLNQQFVILGQSQQPVLPFQWRPQFLNQAYDPNNQFRRLQAEPQQQHQGKIGGGGGLMPNIPPTTQITLPQPQIPPSVPNKWLNNLQQFHQQRHQVQQPQQNKPHQQARLPIFQLLHNSSSSTGKEETAKRYQQLQQKQQYHQMQSHNEEGSNPPPKTGCDSSATPFHHQGDPPITPHMEAMSIEKTGHNTEDTGK